MITRAYLHVSRNYKIQLFLNNVLIGALYLSNFLNSYRNCIYHSNDGYNSCSYIDEEGIDRQTRIKSANREYKERYHHHKEEYIFAACFFTRIDKEHNRNKEE